MKMLEVSFLALHILKFCDFKSHDCKPELAQVNLKMHIFKQFWRNACII